MVHLFALGRGDRFVCLVQWFSLLGCGVGVSYISKLLGAPRRGQILAAVFSISIPQGILQSSGGKNDYVSAFWMVCCVAFLISFNSRPSTRTAVMIGWSAGLALLTKGTAYVFLPPLFITVWAVWPRETQVRLLKSLPLIGLLALSLNLHHYVRNYGLCGELAGCSEANAEKNGVFKFANRHFGLAVTASNLIRNAALHFGTPSDDANRQLTEFLSARIAALGIDPNDPGSTWPGAKFAIVRPLIHEDVMGNPIHLMLIVAVIVILLLDRRNRQIGIFGYAAGVTLGFVGFCAYLCWQPWHTRLHLPLFVLWSPAVGVVLGRRLNLSTVSAGGTVLLMLSMPALFENRLRPLLMEGTSVLETKRDALFPGESTRAYASIPDWVGRTSCASVGIDALRVFDEYPLLMYLHAGLGQRTVRMLGVTNKSARYAADMPPFRPDCVICLQCLQSSERWKTYAAAGMRGVTTSDLTFFYRSDHARSTEHYRIVLQFPPAPQTKPLPEPILTLGSFGAADFFYVRYLGGNKVSLGFHHFWVGGPESESIDVIPGTTYVVEILVDDNMNFIQILLNEKSVLSHHSSVYLHSAAETYVARNPVGGAAAGPVFSGQATLVSAESK
jgi:hypothetical protein